MRKREYMDPVPLIALAGMAVLCQAAFAQQPGPALPPGPAEQAKPASPGGGISLKIADVPITFHPSVSVDVQHSDNIYSAPNNKTGDTILTLIPALRLDARHAGHTLKLQLSTSIGRYQSNKADNYTNTTLKGQAAIDLGTRMRARLDADYVDGVDPRGSNNNPLSATPDHYRETRGHGFFSYGARDAKGRLDLELGQVGRTYLNNRATTEASDRVIDDFGATFHWRMGPKTTILFQGKHSIVDYALPGSTLGSVENMFQAGGTWDATAKTSGTLRFGMTKKDFDDSARSSSTTMSWTGQVRWSPRTYSHVDLILNRAPAETSGGVGDFIDRTSTAARWAHQWSSRLTTEASASHLTDAYHGVARTDNTQQYGVKATFTLRRWLNFGGEYAHSFRNSDDNNFDYKRNAVTLFLTATL